VIFGDGLLAYRRHADGTLEAAEQLASLREALAARPDLWHAWSAIIELLVGMNSLDEAHALAEQATDRFPLLPRIWLDRSNVCRARRDRTGEIESLERALELSPSWGVPARTLAEVYQYGGDFAKARSLLEQAVARNPGDVYNRGCLADILWRMAEKEAALKEVERAIVLEPGYDWGWKALREWSHRLGRANTVIGREAAM
jgi:cellulose synthase operon protein C